ISLLRALLPIGIFVVVLSFLAFLSNNYLVPKVNLKTFSLLWDIRMKSPALDIKEGVFYNGIPNYSIKVNKKLDEVRLYDILIYDHTTGTGNNTVITADSGRMEPFFNDRYMTLVLYNGNSYQEGNSRKGSPEAPTTFDRTRFTENQIVFSLDAFEMNRTPENQWSNNRSIKNIAQLRADLDSMDREHNQLVYFNYITAGSNYSFFTRDRKIEVPEDVLEKKQVYDSLQNIRLQQEYQARNDSMARVAADTPATTNPPTTGDSTTGRVPVDLDRDFGSTNSLTDAPIAVQAGIDSVKDNVKEVLKDTLREKMLNSLSHNRATAAAETPISELVLNPE